MRNLNHLIFSLGLLVVITFTAYAIDMLPLGNPQIDGDTCIQANDAGTIKNSLCVDGATGDVEVLAGQKLKVDKIVDAAGTGAPTFDQGLTTAETSGCINGNMCSSSFAPTITIVSNLTSASALGTMHVIRIGDIIQVHLKLSLYCTTTSVKSEFGVTIPYAKDFTSNNDAAGHGVVFQSTPPYLITYCDANVANDRINCSFLCDETTAPRSGTISFGYSL